MIVSALAIMMMSVVIAAGIGIVFKRSLRKSLCRCVSRPLHTRVKFDPGIRESVLCAHADSAADQRVNLCRLQKSGKRTVTAAVCIHNLLVYNFSILNIIELELLSMSEMLEDFSVFISYCDFHSVKLLSHLLYHIFFTRDRNQDMPSVFLPLINSPTIAPPIMQTAPAA